MKNTLSIIYKRELKQQFCSLAGWLFIALNTAALGICAVWLCLRNGNPSYQYAPETASLILCFTIPLLYGMTVGAEWNRGETPLLLRYVSPVSVTVGKYLAALTLFAIPTAVSAILPLIMLPFGALSLTAAYLGVVSYFLVGSALIALNFFIASLIKHPVIGAVVSISASLLLNIASNVAKIVGNAQSFPFVLAAVILIALITAIMLTQLNNTVIPVAFAILASIGTLTVSVTGNAAAVFRPILKLIAPQYAFYENIYGTLSIQGLIQPILFTVVFLVFTALIHANYNKELTVHNEKNRKEGV